MATTSAIVVSVIGVEGAWRAVRRSPAGLWAGRLEAALVVMVAVTIAGGLGILIGGRRPAEALHFFYGLLALSVVPIADSLSRQATPRTHGIVTLAAAVITLVVIARLFQTG